MRIAPGSWEPSRSLRQRGAPVKAWVEGTPREHVHRGWQHPTVWNSRTEQSLEVEETVASPNTDESVVGTGCASVIATNDEEAGSLATDHPLFWRSASKGKETPGERRASAKVDGRRETRRTL